LASGLEEAERGGGIPVWLDTLPTADRVNLLELYGRSVMLLELGRAVEWVDLFASQALLRCGSQQFKGRDQLLNLARRMIEGEFDLAVGSLTAPTPCRHSLSDVCLFARGESGAAGFAHLNVFAGDDVGAPRLLFSGMYSDQLSRCGTGCWQFVNRVLASRTAVTHERAQQVHVSS
jgi:hypothetical protein